jgi:hypothetical protein
MTELKPKTTGGPSCSVSFHTLDAEGGLLEALCLATAGDVDAPGHRERLKKAKPAPHSIEIVKQLIEFIKTL